MAADVERNMEDITELDLMKEFIKLTDVSLQDTELTVRRFMEYSNVDKNRARYLLSRYEEKGILRMRKVSLNGTSVNAYSPAKGTWKDVVELMKKE